jgi:methyl-accepting chemotaxis protein
VAKILGTLSAKLMVGMGSATVLVLGGAIVASGIQSSERTKEAVYREAQSTAGEVASTVTQDIRALSSAVSTMNAALGAAHDSNVLDRPMVLAMMKSIVARYDLAFGVTFIEEDGAWDGMKGATLVGNNPAGDFASYWSKETGPLTFTAVPTTRDDPWYKVPATTLQPTLTEPFVYDSGTKKITMTTIAYPVVATGGKLLGVGSFDVNLETLSNAVANMRPFGEGHVMLVSGAGSWLATPDASTFMTPYKGAGEQELREALTSGKPQTLHDFSTSSGSVERIIYPFAIPGLNTSWAAIVDVPTKVIAAPIQSQLMMLLSAGALIVGVMLAALYSATTMIVRRPLNSLLSSVEGLKRGNLDIPVSGQQRNDEIGHLSTSLDGFRVALLRGRTIESDAASERTATEEERQQIEISREAARAEQEQVVRAISQALNQLSSGNLTFEVSNVFPEKFESLRNDFNTAVEQLHQSLSAVARSTSMIDGGINEISHSSDDLSRRTEQQAASLEETAAALNEITVNLANAAQRAEDARSVAIHANESAKVSGSVVAGAIDAMGRIERSSATISNIVGVIDEIAFQTNLLALNAGVEAARAGDAGKGFAVVAQEVRELAQRSAKAAKEIKELIRNSNVEVESGVRLVSDTGEALTTIEAYIVEINKHMEAIVVSAQEQSAGLSEVNTAVNHMDQFMQQNAAMVEETNAAGLSLADEAGQLRQLVSRFQLRDLPISSSDGHKNTRTVARDSGPYTLVRDMRRAG